MLCSNASLGREKARRPLTYGSRLTKLVLRGKEGGYILPCSVPLGGENVRRRFCLERGAAVEYS